MSRSCAFARVLSSLAETSLTQLAASPWVPPQVERFLEARLPDFRRAPQEVVPAIHALKKAVSMDAVGSQHPARPQKSTLTVGASLLLKVPAWQMVLAWHFASPHLDQKEMLGASRVSGV